MRKCNICEVEKPLTEFYNRWYKCKSCYKASELYKKQKQRITEYNKKWVSENSDKVLSYRESFYDKNPKYMTEYIAGRRKDPLFKTAMNLRIRLGGVVRAKNYTRKNHLNEILGIDWKGFKLYLSSLFDGGMNWDNYGEWEIDHIKPLSTAKNISEVEQLFHYSNLQPLWRSDNRRKSNKYKE